MLTFVVMDINGDAIRGDRHSGTLFRFRDNEAPQVVAFADYRSSRGRPGVQRVWGRDIKKQRQWAVDATDAARLRGAK